MERSEDFEKRSAECAAAFDEGYQAAKISEDARREKELRREIRDDSIPTFRLGDRFTKRGY